MSKFQIFKKYPRIFWLANLIELFERYAWYGFYMGFGLFFSWFERNWGYGIFSC